MKAADVVIGGEYLALVSGELVRVQVIGTREERLGERVRTTYEVVRVVSAPERATRRRLNPRSAAKLRPAPARAAS